MKNDNQFVEGGESDGTVGFTFDTGTMFRKSGKLTQYLALIEIQK